MGRVEEVFPNDITIAIRELMTEITKWKSDSPECEQRHTAMVLSKLEEAELLSLRMIDLEKR